MRCFLCCSHVNALAVCKLVGEKKPCKSSIFAKVLWAQTQKSNICKQNWTKPGEIAQKNTMIKHKQIPSQTNQDEDGYRCSAALHRYLNFKPFNRVRVKARVTPGNIKQPHPGGANTCTAAVFFRSIQNSFFGPHFAHPPPPRQEMFPDLIAQTRPNDGR